MTSPLPPSLPTTRAFDISPVMYGQPWAEMDSQPVFADADGVRINLLHPDGTLAASVLQTPEAAMALAQLLMHAAGTTIHQGVDDDGRPLPAHVRLARYSAAYKKANS